MCDIDRITWKGFSKKSQERVVIFFNKSENEMTLICGRIFEFSITRLGIYDGKDYDYDLLSKKSKTKETELLMTVDCLTEGQRLEVY